MNKLIYFIFAAGISLQSVALTSAFFIYLSDLFIIFFVIYAIVFFQKISVNFLSIVFISFAISILFANLFNYYLSESFSLISFLSNYLKIVSIALMVCFIPTLIKSLDLEKFFKALKLVVLFHCLIIILDHYVIYPWGFENGLSFSASGEHENLKNRVRGLFEEPSNFAVYVGLTFALIIQYEVLFKSKILRYYDYLIIFSGLVASTSITALVIILINLTQIIYIRMSNHSGLRLSSRSFIKKISIIAISVTLLPIILSSSLSYFSERISDSGNLARYYGSTMAVYKVLQESPLIGFGMGGENQNKFMVEHSLDKRVEFLLIDGYEQETSYPTSYIFNVLGSSGIIALLIFYLIIFGMIYKPETRFLGILIFAIGITKGGVFDLYLWLIITIAFSIGYIYKNSILVE